MNFHPGFFVFLRSVLLHTRGSFMKATASLSESPISFSTLGYRSAAPNIARLMTAALEQPGLLSLAAGFTDNQALPVEAVSSAVLALAEELKANPEHLQYGTNQGRLGLRREIARRLQASDGLGISGDLAASVFITNGSQQALYLAIQALCDPGDIVLVDRPSYFVFLELLAGLGVQARSLPFDDVSGELDTEALRGQLAAMESSGDLRRLKAVYFVGYFSNPTGRSMSQMEKVSLAEALAARGLFVPIIEDAAYRELYFERSESALSILGIPAFADFPKLYTGTLTKSFATGLRIGYGYCSDEGWLSRMLNLKGSQDFGSANFNQAVCERILTTEVFERHLITTRPIYLKKMLALQHALSGSTGLGEAGWNWSAPSGGLFLWLSGPRDLDTGADSAFCRACIDAGVLYVPGELCYADNPEKNRVRLSFGVLQEGQLVEAARRFSQVALDFA